MDHSHTNGIKFNIVEMPIINVDDPAIIAACSVQAAASTSTSTPTSTPARTCARKYKRYHPYVDDDLPYDEFSAAAVVYYETIDIIRGIVTNTDPNNVPDGAVVNSYKFLSDGYIIIRYRIGGINDRCDVVHAMKANGAVDELHNRCEYMSITCKYINVYTMALRQYVTKQRKSMLRSELCGDHLRVLNSNCIKHLSRLHDM